MFSVFSLQNYSCFRERSFFERCCEVQQMIRRLTLLISEHPIQQGIRKGGVRIFVTDRRGRGEERNGVFQQLNDIEEGSPVSLTITTELNGCTATKSNKKSSVVSPKAKLGRERIIPSKINLHLFILQLFTLLRTVRLCLLEGQPRTTFLTRYHCLHC